MVSRAQRRQQRAALAHYAAQGNLLSLMLADFGKLWGYLESNLSQLRKVMPPFLAAATGTATQWGKVAGVLAADYYAAERAAVAVPGTFTAVPAAPAAPAQVQKSLQWATRSLWDTGPTADPVANAAAARILADGAMGYLTLQPARDTITQAVADDPQATGWARFALPGACGFCAMLASRGPVYKTEAQAGFTAHDHERCFPVPLYEGTGYEEPGYIGRWKQLWGDSTQGLHGKAARNAFRLAVAKAGDEARGWAELADVAGRDAVIAAALDKAAEAARQAA